MQAEDGIRDIGVTGVQTCALPIYDYLGHDYYTDIITFDYDEGDTINGDLVISLDTVRSNAEKFGKDYDEELHRVIIHGRSEEHTSELQSRQYLVCRLLLEKKKK